MKKLFIYITFAIWFIYFISTSKNTLKYLKKNNKGKNWIKKNIFKIFHFDSLILFAIFIFFNGIYQESSQLWLVRILLFGVINLYLYLNSFYDKNRINDKIHTDDISCILLILLISLIPIIYFISSNNVNITYYVMFGYIFFNYLLVSLCLSINDFLFKIVLRRNNENK